jgi:GntR family transcriptional regulator of arabinose operon
MAAAKYISIKQHLIAEIQAGTLDAGMKVPSENKLAQMFSVHHSTAQKALRELVADGYIESRRGSGSYVRQTSQAPSGNIAIIVNSAKNEFFGNLIKSIQDILSRSNRHLLFFDTGECFETERSCIESLLEKRKVDGFIIVPTHLAAEKARADFYDGLRARNIPFVLVFPPTGLPHCHCVHSADEKGAVAAVDYLYEQGHRHIGFVGHMLPDNIIQEQRLAGFRRALRERSLTFNEDDFVKVPYPSLADGRKAADRVRVLEPRPSAFVVVSDLLVVGMRLRFQELDIKVPEQIALLGNGNINLSNGDNFSLTTLDDNLNKVGEAAVTLLVNDILNGLSAPQTIVVDQNLIVRQSA